MIKKKKRNNEEGIDDYTSTIVPNVSNIRNPIIVCFDFECKPDGIFTPTEFVLNSGGVILFNSTAQQKQQLSFNLNQQQQSFANTAEQSSSSSSSVSSSSSSSSSTTTTIQKENELRVSLLKTMSMINEMNKINWGHPDGSTCIIIPPAAIIKANSSGFIIYRKWKNVKTSSSSSQYWANEKITTTTTVDRVDPIISVPNFKNVFGTVAIANNGRLVECVVKYDITRYAAEPGLRLEARDIFHRATFSELHIIAAFADINDYAVDLEIAIETPIEIPRPESASKITVLSSPSSSENATIITKKSDSGFEAPPPSPTDPENPEQQQQPRRYRRQTVNTNSPNRLNGNYRVRLSRFLQIVFMRSISYNAFVISDPILFGDHSVGMYALLTKGDVYLNTFLKDDPSLPMNIETATKILLSSVNDESKISFPLKKWLCKSTANDNAALLTLFFPIADKMKWILSLVLQRVLCGSNVGRTYLLRENDDSNLLLPSSISTTSLSSPQQHETESTFMKMNEKEEFIDMIAPEEIITNLDANLLKISEMDMLLVQAMMHECVTI